MSTPLVSVLMPVYNVTSYITEALESLRVQTCQDFEVIVVNDGCPDTERLEAVLQPYRPDIRYVSQKNLGPAAARNTALRLARGRYIALLDPDDAWEPEYLMTQIGVLEQETGIDVLYPDAVIFGSGPDVGRRFMDLSPSRGPVTLESLVTQRCTVMICVTARRETLMRAGMFDESLQRCEDFDLWLRVLKSGGRIEYHRKVLARYRRRPGSLSSDTLSMLTHVIAVLEKTEHTLPLTDIERRVIARECQRLVAHLRLFQAKKAFREGDTRTAIALILQANRTLRRFKLDVARLALRLAPRFLLRAYFWRDRTLSRTFRSVP